MKGFTWISLDHVQMVTNICSHGIKQTFAPPFHPQSNGCAERFVDTLKRQMKKCARDDPHWVQNSLLAYRTTPNASLNGRTPAELFLGRPENLDIDNQAQGEQQPETPNRSPRRVRFADEPLEQIQPIEPRRFHAPKKSSATVGHGRDQKQI
ncbi:hypothetical protein niasHT_028685 [Heterodera trifolii]|uniref:Integrase catalytic domain-containing protein n=1 Tax=Heterodera trifolii TaxID=157864 RepID=A0ABD2JE55_9BILA